MAKQTINLGTAPTGAGGDTFRSGSAKLQANDDEIYSQLGANTQGVLPGALPVNKGGTGATTAAAARTNLGLGTAATETASTNTLDLTTGRLMRNGGGGFAGKPLTKSALHLLTPDEIQTTSIISLGSDGGVGYGSGLLWPSSPTTSGSRCHGLFGSFTSSSLFHVLITNPADITQGVTKSVVRTAANTTVDSNGFIKNASPIVELYADKIELNDEAQQQDITFEKLGVGDYLIKGSTGFAQEGWYVETPKDANGNVLFSVIYTTLENGDISVKTYKKKFDFETVSIVADLDNPVDITENRWIDLRLQELPQSEIEMPESIAPPEFQPTGLAQAVATVMESYHDPEQ